MCHIRKSTRRAHHAEPRVSDSNNQFIMNDASHSFGVYEVLPFTYLRLRCTCSWCVVNEWCVVMNGVLNSPMCLISRVLRSISLLL
jgi:hypothetical protein